jgi:hypothetical protein
VVQEDSYKIYFVIFEYSYKFFTNFGILPYFLEFKTIRKMIKITAQRRASNRPTACDAWPGGLPRAAGWATAWRPSPAEEAARDARKQGAPCALVVRSPRAARTRRRDDALDGGAVGAGRWQGAAGEHRWGPGVAPGRRSGDGAHPSGGST